MFVFSGCSSSKPFPEETSLLPASNDEIYWLTNFVIEGPDSTKNFARMLVVQTHSQQASRLSLHISLNWANNTWYIQESRASEPIAEQYKQVWPIVLTVPGDSIRPEWKWYWNRKEMWLNFSTEIRGEHVNQGWRIHFPNQKPFETTLLSSFPEICLLDPLRVRFRMVHEAETDAWMHVAYFRHAGKAIAAQGVTTAWMDIDLEPDAHLSLLTSISDSSVSILQHRFWTNANTEGKILTDLQATIIFEGKWVSPYSKKNYPLRIRLFSQEGEIDCGIVAFREDQEVSAGRQSFWMGGIDVISRTSGKKIGAGNMYIFTH